MNFQYIICDIGRSRAAGKSVGYFVRSVKTGAGEVIFISWRYIHRGADNLLVQPGRKQSNVSVRMA